MYLPAFGAIGDEFAVSPIAVQQTLSTYLFAFAFMMLWHGAISDAFGRRPVVLGGLAVYAIASLGCAIAGNVESLWLFRTLQGLSSGAGLVVGRALIRDRYEGPAAQRVMSQITLVFGVAPALAPVIGGALLNLLGWRAIFWLMVAFSCGVLLRENRLTAQVTDRERRILAEFPTIAEMLALAVAAGEGAVPALDRVVERSSGELSADLSRVLADVRTGTPVARALDQMAARTGLPVVARFAEGMAVAIERGTPLAEVLHAQAADVREAGRRQLIETGARKEVLMMVPVVFLVLPVTVLFAFWPGVVGLHLVTP